MGRPEEKAMTKILMSHKGMVGFSFEVAEWGESEAFARTSTGDGLVRFSLGRIIGAGVTYDRGNGGVVPEVYDTDEAHLAEVGERVTWSANPVSPWCSPAVALVFGAAPVRPLGSPSA